MVKGIIYKIIFPNKKVYIGQTIQPIHDRIRSHINGSFNKKSLVYNSKVARAIRKYYKDRENAHKSIKFFILATAHKTKLNKLEKKYISDFNCVSGGYNTVQGGGGTSGYKHSDLAKKKISAASKKQCGENATVVKANWKIVKEIRKMFLLGTKVSDIQRAFSVLSYNSVIDIVKNRTWKDKEFADKIKNISKMDRHIARKIRKDYASGKHTLKSLSNKYKKCSSQICNIVYNKAWVDKRNSSAKAKKIARRNIVSHTKLDHTDVKNIRRKYRSGKYTHRQLAKIYMVSVPTISNIVNRKTWKEKVK